MVINVFPVMSHCYILFIFGGELEKKSGIRKNCGSWSDKNVVILPLTEFLISKFGILQKILSIRVLWVLCIVVASSAIAKYHISTLEIIKPF